MDTPTNTDTDDYENYADLIYENWRDIQEQEALDPPKPNKNHKRCLRCGVAKPIREYVLPRHRLCAACRSGSPSEIGERAAARFAAQPLQPLPPARPPVDAWLATKNYNTRYARQRRADAEALVRASGKPVKTPKYSSVKFCVRCKREKPAIQFDHPRDRICLACYNPNG